LELPAEAVTAYREALLERYRNPEIRHLLTQIAADGSQKLPIRAVPVLRAELAEGRVADGATRVVAAWIAHLRGAGAPVTDTAAHEVVALAAGEPHAAVRAVLGRLGLTSEPVAVRVQQQLAGLEQLGRQVRS
jgi:fructuronate reductase